MKADRPWQRELVQIVNHPEFDRDQGPTVGDRSTIPHLERIEMMTTPISLMVHLPAGALNDALLKLSVDLASRLKVAKVIGVSACRPVKIYASPDTYVPPEFITWDLDQIEKQLKATRSDFQSAFDGKVAAVEWRSAVVTHGSVVDYVTQQARVADLLVTAVEEGDSLFARSHDAKVADLVLRAGRPVLVSASAQDKLDLRTVVVAWKDTREARRGVQDALPLLRLAERAIVMEIAAVEELADAGNRTRDVAGWLAGHGVLASAHAIEARGAESEQLRNIANALEIDAGLVVGGAYGHTRLREWVLGGMTRNFLLQPSRCSLVSH